MTVAQSHAAVAVRDAGMLASAGHDFPAIGTPHTAAESGSRTLLSKNRQHAQRVRITDTAIVVLAAFGAQLLTLPAQPSPASVGYRLLVAIAVAAAWLIALRIARADHFSVINSGLAEYRRVAAASAATLAAVGTLSFLIGIDSMRHFWLALALVGTPVLVVSRGAWHLASRSGRKTTSMIIAGTPDTVVDLVSYLDQHPELGYQVIGASLPDTTGNHGSLLVGGREIPVCGDLRSARASVVFAGADIVALTSVDLFDQSSLRELTWRLEALKTEVVVIPRQLTGFGPRITMHAHPELPLLAIEPPRYDRANSIAKRCFDLVFGTLILVAAAPIMIACAVAIKLGDGGPIFYRAERVGLDNRAFRMWKFRSMVIDADKWRDELAGLNEGNLVLFKMREDPRVTKVGQILRRFSLDELPQIFNVLDGSMSLVGPRPPLAEEVASYDDMVTNRMLVRPGMTGLWQVSGRSDLSWAESVDLDLQYVEHWSLAGDVSILFRTVRAVLTADGAY